MFRTGATQAHPTTQLKHAIRVFANLRQNQSAEPTPQCVIA